MPNKDRTFIVSLISGASALYLFTIVPASAQGLMEYGGLMAAPKGLPNAGVINGLTSPYKNFAPLQTTPQAYQQQSSQTLAPYQIMGADGNPQVDPRKVKDLTMKASKAYEAAKVKMKIANPTAKDLKEAEANLREAITYRNSIWGYSDPHIPGMLNMLGGIYEKQHQLPSAESCYKNSLVYITKKSGSGSYDRVDTLLLLARLYDKDKRPKEALDNYSQVAQIRERQSGEDSMPALKARLDWARLSASLDKPDTAAIYERCLKTYEALGKLENADSAKTAKDLQAIAPGFLENYGAFLTKKGKTAEADALKQKIVISSALPEPAGKPEDPKATNETKATSETKPATEAIKAPELKPAEEVKAHSTAKE